MKNVNQIKDFEACVSQEFLLFVVEEYGFWFNNHQSCQSLPFSKYFKSSFQMVTSLKVFPIESGVREGDCISPLLFVLVIERVIRTILNCNEIKCFLIPHHKNSLFQYPNDFPLSTKILAFADDITPVGRRDDLKLSLEIFELYCMAFRCKIELEQMHYFFLLLFKLLFSR